MFNNRWHHGLHWELDFPEALTAGREDVYLGFFYRNWGGRPDAISREAQEEYIRAYRLPGAMRAGFNLYRATPQDVADNEAFVHQGKLEMPVLCYGGPLGRGRGMGAIESLAAGCNRRPRWHRRRLRPLDSRGAARLGDCRAARVLRRRERLRFQRARRTRDEGVPVALRPLHERCPPVGRS